MQRTLFILVSYFFVGLSTILIYTCDLDTLNLSDITIASEKYSSHLVVNNVTGYTVYKCLAENVVGADDATCIITVVNRGKSSYSFIRVKYTVLHIHRST